jgi:hypothetical protein
VSSKRPKVMLSTAQGKVDQKGNITDAKTKEKIAEMVTALAHWSRKLSL